LRDRITVARKPALASRRDKRDRIISPGRRIEQTHVGTQRERQVLGRDGRTACARKSSIPTPVKDSPQWDASRSRPIDGHLRDCLSVCVTVTRLDA